MFDSLHTKDVKEPSPESEDLLTKELSLEPPISSVLEESAHIKVPPKSTHDPLAKDFKELGVRSEILEALQTMGFTKAFPVQSQTFHPAMMGQDLIIQARTGSGKTAAFVIPLVQGLLERQGTAQAGRPYILVLVPTRELALQVTKEFQKIAAHTSISSTAIYGGAPMGAQVDLLSKGVHVVVGTPGRVLDHLRRGTLDFTSVRTLVLDEADEMFSRGFYEDIHELIKQCPSDKQTLLFSATMPADVERLCQKVMRHPTKIQLSSDFVSALEIEHSYYMVSGMARCRDLLRVLDIESPESAIIFCNTREETAEVAEFLRAQGLSAGSISGSLTQKQRERVISLMRAGKIRYLVATDIAARGIDISHITHVFNYMFPESSEVYIHRTGRTGRAGRAGKAISLIGPRELGNFYTFKLTYKLRPSEKTFPKTEELDALREKQYLARLKQEILRDPSPLFYSLVRKLSQTKEGERLLAVLVEKFVTAPMVTEELDFSSGLEEQENPPQEDTALPSNERSKPQDHPARESRRGNREPRNSFSKERTGREQTGRERTSREQTSREQMGDAEEHHRSSRGSSEHRRKTKESPSQERGFSSATERPRRSRDKRKQEQPVSSSSASGSHTSLDREPNSSKESSSRENVSKETDSYQVIHEPIQLTEGREYWEAWIDSRQPGPSLSEEMQSSNGQESNSTSATTPKPSAEETSSFTDTPSTKASHAKSLRKSRNRRKPTGTSTQENSQASEQHAKQTEDMKDVHSNADAKAASPPKVYINLGKRHGFTQERLQELLSAQNLPQFPTQVRLTHSYLFPTEESLAQVVSALNGQVVDNRTILCERARK